VRLDRYALLALACVDAVHALEHSSVLTFSLFGSCLKMMRTNRSGARVFYHCLRHAKGHASDTDLARFAVVLANAIVVRVQLCLECVPCGRRVSSRGRSVDRARLPLYDVVDEAVCLVGSRSR
jgi:hypothetical protein